LVYELPEKYSNFAKLTSVGGYETGEVSQDDVSADRFSRKHNIEVGRGSRQSVLTQTECIITYEKSETKHCLRRRHFVVCCRRVIWIIIFTVEEYKWRYTSQ
jgi:hypothetical protein